MCVYIYVYIYIYIYVYIYIYIYVYIVVYIYIYTYIIQDRAPSTPSDACASCSSQLVLKRRPYYYSICMRNLRGWLRLGWLTIP